MKLPCGLHKTSTSLLLSQTSLEAADRPHLTECLIYPSQLYLPASAKMLYPKGIVSGKRWHPIHNVRTRPTWVQTTAFDFMKQAKILRFRKTTLPKVDSINLPLDRQFIVAFGDLDPLCECIVSALLPQPGVVATANSVLNSPGIHPQKIWSSLCSVWGPRRPRDAVDRILQSMQATTVPGYKT